MMLGVSLLAEFRTRGVPLKRRHCDLADRVRPRFVIFTDPERAVALRPESASMTW